MKCLLFLRKESLIWKVDWEDFSKSVNITDVTADLYEPTESIDGFLDEVINTK